MMERVFFKRGKSFLSNIVFVTINLIFSLTVFGNQNLFCPEINQNKDFIKQSSMGKEFLKNVSPNIYLKLSPTLREEISGQKISSYIKIKNFNGEKTQPDTFIYLIDLGNKQDLKDKLKNIKSKADKKYETVKILKEHSDKTQKSVIKILEQLKNKGDVFSYQPFWLSNQIAVEGNIESIKVLAELNDVLAIRANRLLTIPTPSTENYIIQEKNVKFADGKSLPAENWNIDKIDADKVWEEFGKKGDGVVIGLIDSGVDWEHPALKTKYRGYEVSTTGTVTINHSRNWFEFDGALYPNGNYGETMSKTPADPIAPYSGTFNLGIILGEGAEANRKIGVAPNAKWTACTPRRLNWVGNISDDVTLHKCFQYLLAPTNQTGELSSQAPNMAPDIINCSFEGTIGIDTTFKADIDALTAAGIIVICAAGDTGAEGGVLSPASLQNTIAVGATDSSDKIYRLCAGGPSFWSNKKPDISAPGVNILSSVPRANGEYVSGRSGTGLAAAHVSGVAALLLSINPNLTSEEIYLCLTGTAIDLGSAGFDTTFGYGRVDAYRAVKLISDNARLIGNIYNSADSNTKIAGAKIEGVDINDQKIKFSVTSDSQGNYTIHGPEGIYKVTASAFDYNSYVYPQVHMFKNIYSTLNFPLTKKTLYKLSGTVRDSATAASLISEVTVLGTNVKYSTAGDGNYTIYLPLGTYQVKATAASHKSVTQTITLDRNKTLNFSLPTSPKIYLIDADHFYGWQDGFPAINYYKNALDKLGYLYDFLQIDGAWSLPTLSTLQKYNVVIWIQSTSSPTQIGAGSLLENYLAGGGKLFLAGEEIAKGEKDTPIAKTYLKYNFITDELTASGVNGKNILSGLSFSFGGLYTAPKGIGTSVDFKPDIITSSDSISIPILLYNDNQNYAAGIKAAPCSGGYKAILLCVGLESISPVDSHSQMIDKIITWLIAAKSTNDFISYPGSAQGNGIIRSTYKYSQTIVNTGSAADKFNFTKSLNKWNTKIFDPVSKIEISDTGTLNPCQSKNIEIQVEIPGDVELLTTDTVQIKITSQAKPAVSETISMITTAFLDWQQQMTWNGTRYGFISASSGDCDFFIFGGLNSVSNIIESKTLKYSLGKNIFEEVSEMPIPIAHSSAVSLNNMIYLVGGFNPNLNPSSLDILTVYDPQNDNYFYAKNLPVKVHALAAAEAYRKIYIFGGSLGGDSFSDKTYEYDPLTNSWRERAPMPYGARAFLSAASINNKIYVVGGYPQLNIMECYDPISNSWETKAPMKHGRRSFSLIAKDGFLYAIGGSDELWNSVPYVERYNPATNTWSMLYPLKDQYRGGCGVAINQGNIIVFGGIGQNGKIQSEALPLENYFRSSSITTLPSIPSINDEITINLNLNNSGAKAANLIHVSSPIPENCEFVENSGTGGIIFSPQNNQVEWNGAVPSNSLLTLSYKAKFISPDSTGIKVPLQMLIDTDSCEQSVVYGELSVSGPDLSFSKKDVDKKLAAAGDTIKYTLSLENRSFTENAIVSLFDSIPQNTTFIEGSISGGASYNSQLNAIEWTGTLPKGTSGPPEIIIMDTDNDAEPYQWDDVSSTGQELTLSSYDDDGKFIPIGFDMNYFGQVFNTIGISTNGYIKFGGDINDLRASENRSFPSSASSPHNILGVFWDDLKISPVSGDFIKYQLKGTSPNRRLIIQWRVHHFSDTNSAYAPFEFQVIIFEESQWIKCYYRAMTSVNGNGQSASIGLEDSTGAYGLTYLNNGQPSANLIHNELAVAMYHQPPGFFTKKIIAFNVKIADSLPCNTTIANSAILRDNTYIIDYPLNAQTIVNSGDLSNSSMVVQEKEQFAGKQLHYEVTIKNTGNYPTNVTYINPIPAETIFDGGLTNGATYNSQSNQIEWNKNLIVGEIQVINFNLRIKEELFDQTKITNRGFLTADCSSSTTISAETKVKSYDLTSSLFLLDKTEAARNDSVKAAIYVVNSGGLNTWGQLEFTFPSHLIFKPNSISTSTGTATFNESRKKITWDFNINGYEMVSILFDATVAPNAPLETPLSQTATIYYFAGSVNVSSSIIIKSSNVSSSKFDIVEDTAEPNSILNHTLNLKNTSIAPVNYLLAWVNLSQYENFIPETASPGIFYDASGAVYYIGGLTANGQLSLNYQTHVKPDTPNKKPIVNELTLTTNDQVLLFSDSATMLAPDIYTTKTVDKSLAKWQDILNYEIYVKNNGDSQAKLSIIDTLPKEVTLIASSLSVTNGLAEYLQDEHKITFSGTLNKDAQLKINYAVQITSHDLIEFIQNTAILKEENANKTYNLSARTDLKWVYEFDWGQEGWLVYALPNIFPSVQLGRIGFNFNTNKDSFAFWGSPFNTIKWIPNYIYRGRFNVKTSVSDKSVVPQIRLRTNAQNFQTATTLVVNSAGNGDNSPTPSGTSYDVYLKTPQEGMASQPYLIYGFDLLCIDPNDAATGNIYLEQLEITRFPQDSIEQNYVEEKRFTFDEGDENWVFYTPAGFTPPDKIVADGAIGFKSNSNTSTFSIWQSQLNAVKAQSGKIYNGKFRIKSDQTDRKVVPNFRLRMNAYNFQFVQVQDFTSTGDADMSPSTEYKTYEIFFTPPQLEDEDPLNYFSPAFDILNLTPDDAADASLYLDDVLIRSFPKPEEK